jgi:hypothetical protein
MEKWKRDLQDYIRKDFFMDQLLAKPIPLTATALKEAELKAKYRRPLMNIDYVDIETRYLQSAGFTVTTYADFAYTLKDACAACGGRGQKDGEECWHCGGEGTDPNPD